MSQFYNEELFDMMCHEGWLHEVRHHTGERYLEPEFVTRAGKSHEHEVWVHYKNEDGQEFISDGERFFGETEPGVFRFTVADK